MVTMTTTNKCPSLPQDGLPHLTRVLIENRTNPVFTEGPYSVFFANLYKLLKLVHRFPDEKKRRFHKTDLAKAKRMIDECHDMVDIDKDYVGAKRTCEEATMLLIG